MKAKLFIISLFTVASCLWASAQYAVNWHVIAGGGGVSTGAVYSVSGTIGQHDASGPMTGSTYSLTGGFWAFAAVQTPGAPLLSIMRSNNSAIVSWVAPSTGFVLQTNSDLSTTNWVNDLSPVTISNGSNNVTVTPPLGNLFFRLKNP
jgi:hypothetical protein